MHSTRKSCLFPQCDAALCLKCIYSIPKYSYIHTYILLNADNRHANPAISVMFSY